MQIAGQVSDVWPLVSSTSLGPTVDKMGCVCQLFFVFLATCEIHILAIICGERDCLMWFVFGLRSNGKDRVLKPKKLCVLK